MIVLTARDRKNDVVQGLQAGADDYVTKPFDPRELRARHAIGARIIQLEERLRASQEQLHHLATYDALTGLINRRAIREHAEAELARASRTNGLLTLALIDVDHFKAVNDRHGHAAGDLALQMVSDTLAATIRPYDWLGRWGGEEFLAILPGADDAAALGLGERLCEAIAAAPLTLSDAPPVPLSISVGLADGRGRTVAELDLLLQRADKALYTAKREGRNRVCVFRDEAPPRQKSA